MILEVAILNVRGGLESQFEAALAQASPIIASMPGYVSHQLQLPRNIESLLAAH
jgi:heme-degrading monooxygenase HmoA